VHEARTQVSSPEASLKCALRDAETLAELAVRFLSMTIGVGPYEAPALRRRGARAPLDETSKGTGQCVWAASREHRFWGAFGMSKEGHLGCRV
jgi:hypothetical protein